MSVRDDFSEENLSRTGIQIPFFTILQIHKMNISKVMELSRRHLEGISKARKSQGRVS